MHREFLNWALLLVVCGALAACGAQGPLESPSTNRASLTVAPKLPFESGQTSKILQGFESAYSHGKATRGCGNKALLLYSLDFKRPQLSPVLAVQAGTVTHIHTTCKNDIPACNHGVGNEVVVDHGQGLNSAYYHLEPGITVKVGDTVCAGLVLGRVGMTGFTSGPHIHFHFQDVSGNIYGAGCDSNTLKFDGFMESNNLTTGSEATSQNSLVSIRCTRPVLDVGGRSAHLCAHGRGVSAAEAAVPAESGQARRCGRGAA